MKKVDVRKGLTFVKDLIFGDEREPVPLELRLDLCFHGEEGDCAKSLKEGRRKLGFLERERWIELAGKRDSEITNTPITFIKKAQKTPIILLKGQIFQHFSHDFKKFSLQYKIFSAIRKINITINFS